MQQAFWKWLVKGNVINGYRNAIFIYLCNIKRSKVSFQFIAKTATASLLI